MESERKLDSLAAAPIAKKTASKAAAVGTEIGRPAALPENKSMIRPMVKGMERETEDETKSCRQHNKLVSDRSGKATAARTHETNRQSDRLLLWLC